MTRRLPCGEVLGYEGSPRVLCVAFAAVRGVGHALTQQVHRDFVFWYPFHERQRIIGRLVITFSAQSGCCSLAGGFIPHCSAGLYSVHACNVVGANTVRFRAYLGQNVGSERRINVGFRTVRQVQRLGVLAYPMIGIPGNEGGVLLTIGVLRIFQAY